MANKAIFLIFQGCWTDKIKSILRLKCDFYKALGCLFVKGHKGDLVLLLILLQLTMSSPFFTNALKTEVAFCFFAS